IASGAKVLIGAAANSEPLHGREVVGEALVEHVDPVGDAGESEGDAGVFNADPIDLPLVFGDVDARETTARPAVGCAPDRVAREDEEDEDGKRRRTAHRLTVSQGGATS